MEIKCCKGFLDLEVGDIGKVVKIDGYRDRSVKVLKEKFKHIGFLNL